MQAHQSETDEEKTARKTLLRERLLRIRRELAPADRDAAAGAIEKAVIGWWQARRPASLGVYWPIRGEPDLRPLYAVLQAHGVQLALPVVHDPEHAGDAGRAQPLRFLAWTPGEQLLTDRFGAAAPARQRPLAPSALLIPCVGFNAQRVRLGYGGGFYDRLLAQTPRPLTLGVAYDCAEVGFNGEAHDIAMDAIVTERRLLD
ncbi:5-formyltetrahydrofolate cyclo-ligase [Oxalobacteraceae bacterium CAVE-383]|nr:5-formyltetrahydrofolate cyclo-ligase [Oxalobacteraceae bacterium CAVE-383]